MHIDTLKPTRLLVLPNVLEASGPRKTATCGLIWVLDRWTMDRRCPVMVCYPKVLLVPSLRIPIGIENQLVVQFIHVHGVEKDYKGLDFSEIEKSFVDEGKDSGLFGDQELRFKKYDVVVLKE
ncbi:hypothetical protein HanOQP8_Chr06g0222901 [Helianthus annuus]|nr:hypothetical protein HanOQP8_Chr06g0222901 [Helianthus annuus]